MPLNPKKEEHAEMTLADLYQEFEPKLHRCAIRLARDSNEADDLVQETFIRTMGHLELLRQLNGHQRQAWLFRVLKNLWLDQQFARQREEILMEQFAQQARFSTHRFILDELVSLDLFDQIPEKYRELLHKRYVLGMNSQEIARELGIPAATVRTRLHLAIKKLRAKKSRFL